MKHIITITLDIPAGMEAAVAHAAYMAQEAIVALNKYADGEIRSADRAMGLLLFATNDLVDGAQEVWDELKAEAQRMHDARNLVRDALSEISHAMSEADSQWRMRQTATTPTGE